MKYIKKFDTLSAQTEYLAEAGIDTYVGYVNENDTVYYDDALPPHDYSKDYLTIESLDDNNTIYLQVSYTAITKTVSASTDNGETWTEYVSSADGSGTTLATLNTGDKLLIKGENTTYATYNYNQFKSTGRFEVKGNIMSLVSGDSFASADELTERETFSKLFYQCTGLTSAENLVLPATTLAYGCCYSMFQGCTSLTTAPVLPATTLAQHCYQYMFDGCTNLSSITCLATNISANYCTAGWLSGVATSGTFVKAASMTGWSTGDDGIPSGWTVVDA